ncbi:MAG: alpha/beta hydrolase [Actinomycetota bacterium]|nr:alpha/beta hydrolase [Actinomycetota bacterium]
MSAFILIPGAGGDAWYWSKLVPELCERGHDAVAVDIREDDPSLGLPEYAQLVVDAIGDRMDVVLVGQSLGGFTVPVVASRQASRAIVLVNAMIPLPGETPGAWWGNTGSSEARAASDREAGRDGTFDVETYFLHDLSDQTKADAYRAGAREPSATPFGQPCEFTGWPDIPIHVVVGADDRFFPADFQRRVAKERLGVDADLIRGGHLVALANPSGLADYLVRT